MSSRYRAVSWAVAVLVVGWLIAWAGFTYARNSRVSVDKVARHLQSVDLANLDPQARQAAIDKLIRQMRALPVEERRRVRLAGDWSQWFEEMTEAEKARFLEGTLPSGFKQMLQAFEQLPETKRRRAVEAAVQDLQRAQKELASENPAIARRLGGTNQPPLSPELQQKVVSIGLRSFYSESSAQAKAELAPVLEELQRLMESGRLFRSR